MRNAYRILAIIIAVEVVIQAMAMDNVGHFKSCETNLTDQL